MIVSKFRGQFDVRQGRVHPKRPILTRIQNEIDPDCR